MTPDYEKKEVPDSRKNDKTPEEKYLNDPTYRYIIDMMMQTIEGCKIKPPEFRKMAKFACSLHIDRQNQDFFKRFLKTSANTNEATYTEGDDGHQRKR
jgi:hypothetical protein